MSSLILPYEALEIPDPGIYLPEYLCELFYVTPDFQSGGTLEGAVEINWAALAWQKGEIDFQTYTDILSFYGLPAEQFVESRLEAYDLK